MLSEDSNASSTFNCQQNFNDLFRVSTYIIQIVYMKVELPNLADPDLLATVEDNSSPESADSSNTASTIQPIESSAVKSQDVESIVRPCPVEETKKDVIPMMPEKVLVSILKSPTRKNSQVSLGSSRKEDIRTTFSKDVEVNCFEEHVNDGAYAEKRSSVKKQEPTRIFSFNLEEDALVDEKDGEERLTVGLIDYALLIGPLDDGYGGGTGTGTAQGPHTQSGQNARKIHVHYSLNPDSDAQQSSFSGYGSILGEEQELSVSPTSRTSVSRNSAPIESDMCIWDRFPLDDHEESPLPPKVGKVQHL